jgi:hypothetical protein
MSIVELLEIRSERSFVECVEGAGTFIRESGEAGDIPYIRLGCTV